jgi:hypothetical protein
MDSPLNLQIVLHTDPKISDEKLERITRELAQEIKDVGVESVGLVSDAKPVEGARSAEAVTLGAIALAVLPVVLPKIMDFLQARSLRGSGKTITIKSQQGDRLLEVSFAPDKMPSTDELKQFIQDITQTVSGNPPQPDQR